MGQPGIGGIPVTAGLTGEQRAKPTVRDAGVTTGGKRAAGAARRARLEKDLLEIQAEEDQYEADSRSHRTTADLVSPQRSCPFGIYLVEYCGIRSFALFQSQPGGGGDRFWYLWTPGLRKRVRARLKMR